MEFRFQQFNIGHDRAAMKVGTDGILLGAWSELEGAQRILDIGAGSGLLSLMAAQRNASALIEAVEIDEPSAQQAAENFQKSKWSARLSILNTDARDFARREESRAAYDVILCNPPFFRAGSKSPDPARGGARHQTGLSCDALLEGVSRMLTSQGRLNVIFPAADSEVWIAAGAAAGLSPKRITRVRPLPGVNFKRVLVEFRLTPQVCHEDQLTIELTKHRYTPEFRALTREYYVT
jgi:tRNA1Val (adenine37-N6)-methyltransferase